MKKLSLFKNTEKTSDSAPDYRLVASYQDGQGNWVNETVGSFWKPKSDNPKGPALTGSLSDAREYNGKQYPGYEIAVTGVSKPAATRSESVLPRAPMNEELIDPNDIPF